MRYLRVITAVTILLAASAASAQETVSYGSTSNRQAWRGETAGSQAGFYLDRGEVNSSDNRRDLIVGAPGWQADRGRVYVVYGGPVFGGQQPLSSADAIFTGVAAGDRFGEATAAGYVTANELTVPQRDLVIGAPGVNGNAGAVYLFGRGLANGLRLGAASALLTISGAPAGARLGAALATGDLDGDGYREIIIGAPGTSTVYVVRGGPGVSGTINLSVPSAAFFTIQGPAGVGVGQVLASGDLAGHGAVNPSTIYDLAIGAPLANAGAGAVYVIKGRTSNTFSATMTLTTDADARYDGIDAGDHAGKTLQIAFLDKDKFADLIVGAPQAAGPANGRAQAGEVYLVWGAAAVSSRSLANADVTIYGAGAGYQEGAAIGFGDANRDGTSDLVSLAPGASAAGDLHMFLGRARSAWAATIDLLSVFPDRRLIGDPAVGPITSATFYDLTGEGFDDIVAGIPGNVEGVVYVSYSVGPVVTDSPLPHTVNPNHLTTFSAAASGSPAPTVQWQVSSNGSAFTNIAGATNTSYTFVAQTTDNGKRYRAVFTNSSASATSGAATLGVRSTFQAARRADFDGDGLSDVMLWRPSTGTWYALTSGSSFAAGVSRQWGNNSLGDKPFQADMDGDGIADLIVWRPTDGTWYWLTSGTDYNYANATAKQWGNESLGDVPMVGDVDGDGLGDLIIWRASTGTWYWLTSSSGYSYASGNGIQWGNPSLGDQPVLGDYDGDGRADLAVWRASTGTWYWLTSSSGYSYASAHGIQWGNESMGDQVKTGDIDGDGLTDLILWRPTDGTWYWLLSSTNYSYAGQGNKQWGNNSLGDKPMIGDFDGDGKADLAVWRSSTGTWYWLTSSSGYSYNSAIGRQWGTSTDTPMVR